MSLKVLKALQLSTIARNIFGMCPYKFHMDQKDPLEVVQITTSSAYLPLLLFFITEILFLLAMSQLAVQSDDNGQTAGYSVTGSITFIVLAMSLLTNFITYTFSVLVTFFKRDSFLKNFQTIISIYDKLDKDYNVQMNHGRLTLLSNSVLASNFIYDLSYVFLFISVINVTKTFAMPLIYFVQTISGTLSCYDLINTIVLLCEIFELMEKKIPRKKYNTEMFITFFEALDLLEEIGTCQGMRECMNVGNEVFIILSQLFVLVYQVESDMPSYGMILFGIMSILPRVVNLFALARYGSKLTERVSFKDSFDSRTKCN